MATGIPRGTTADPGGPSGPDGTAGLPRTGWTAGRVVTVIIGSVLAMASLGLLGGGTLLWADQALRHDGYVTTGTATYSTTGHTLASERISLSWGLLPTRLIGDVRLRVTAASPARPVFVAVGPADRVAAYLSGTAHATVTGTGTTTAAAGQHGTARPAPPRTAGIWAAQAAGTSTQVLRWTAQPCNWMAVAMNPDGSAGVAVRADAGISAPGLPRLGTEAITGRILPGTLSAALTWVSAHLAAGAR